MARLRHYLHSVASGYVAMGTNILCTLISVPLALAYLSKAEFGLWGLTTQIGFYIALVDFGTSGAMSRILVDYKDDRHSREYSGIVRTGISVSAAQAVLVGCFGFLAALFLGKLLKVPAELQHAFRIVVLGQTSVLAIGFAVRVFGYVLVANQRLDIGSYAQVIASLANIAALWFCLESDLGVYSVIWAQAASVLSATIVLAAACFRLGLWPTSDQGSFFDRVKFKELFAYGKDVFLFTLGGQFINGSHLIIVTRVLDLQAVAVWSVCTRAFGLIIQLVWRIMEVSAPALSEMLVRGEQVRLLARFRHLTVVTTSLAVAAGLTFAACNQAFVALWAGREFTWPIVNDVLLTCWLIVVIVQRCHISLQGVTKQLQIAKYVYFAEGITFFVLGLIVTERFGFTGLIVASIVCTLSFSCLYGLRKTTQQFRVSRGDLLRGWLAPAMRVLALGVPLVVGVGLVTSPLDAFPKLVLRAAVVSSAGLVIVWRFGIPMEVKTEVLLKSPRFLRRILDPLSKHRPYNLEHT